MMYDIDTEIADAPEWETVTYKRAVRILRQHGYARPLRALSGAVADGEIHSPRTGTVGVASLYRWLGY